MNRAMLLLKRRILGIGLLLCAMTVMVLLFREGGAVETMRADAQPGVPLPVIMYHSVLRDPQRSGQYVVTPAQLEEDLLYLKKNGYTTVLPSELENYVGGECDLPERPVMITFDDGYYNNLVYVLPILKRLDMKAVVSIVGSYTEKATSIMDQNPSYAHLIWEDVCTLAASGHVEIGSHSYGLHTAENGREGVIRKLGESAAAHEAVLTEDISKFQETLAMHCGIVPITFAYPFGQWDEESEAVLRKMGFAVTMTCRERMNYIERNPASLVRLGRYNRPSGISTAAFMQKVLKN